MRKWLKATLDTVMILLVGGVWGIHIGVFWSTDVCCINRCRIGCACLYSLD